MTGETLVDLSLQRGYPARPLKDVWIPAGSAAAFRLLGLRVSETSVVNVTAVNADGVAMTAEAERDGDGWLAVFPEAHFLHHGVVEHGLQVTVTGGGRTFMAAAGGLVVEAVDGSASAGDPVAHLVTKDELAALFDDLELADTATQREVRTMLQEVIAKLKAIGPASA